MKHKSRTVIIIIPAQSAQKHTARFEAIATELRAAGAGIVRAMDLEAAVYQSHGDAPEHSDGSEECRPARIPIIEVAFGKGMWWSIRQEMSAELCAKFEAGQDAVYTGIGVTHGRDHGNPTTKRFPSIDT